MTFRSTNIIEKSSIASSVLGLLQDISDGEVFEINAPDRSRGTCSRPSVIAWCFFHCFVCSCTWVLAKQLLILNKRIRFIRITSPIDYSLKWVTCVRTRPCSPMHILDSRWSCRTRFALYLRSECYAFSIFLLMFSAGAVVYFTVRGG